MNGRVSRMDGGSFENVVLAFPPHTFALRSLQQFQGFSWLTSWTWCCGTNQECQGATVTLIRGVEILGAILDRRNAKNKGNPRR
eukprot:9498723-Pyramimonas_sp.AAC.1